MNTTTIRKLLLEVCDPEIPILTIEDIGILRDVSFQDNTYKITITPTYSGCPAMYHIRDRIKEVLDYHHIDKYEVITQISPAWTTEWMSEEAKLKLKESGIAPPQGANENDNFDVNDLLKVLKSPKAIQCPFCDSIDTKLINKFGSTACKSLHYCNHCLQAFEHFKCH
ncbi:MAG TPA: phenylacetate-CoA oxygenase subunit PaaJ [Candidatus Kapabacteria bacterium]|nr:phenylacetate-CoA oxygenase subunit PaaJ [Candidatus Kapabacteria bacterium]